MSIGFIGLGHMGAGMAGNILKAGHQLIVYNRTPGKDEGLLRQGAHAARNIAEACRGEVVFTMLADDCAVQSIVYGDKGILTTLSKGAVHISSSTISVALSERLTADHAAAGQKFVAAPVFGRPNVAAAGQLFIIAAGAPDAISLATRLFDAIGEKTFVVSETPKSANFVKLSGNFLIASVFESLGEAMALISKAGVDKHQFINILTSTLFGTPVYETYGALIADQAFEPAGFAAQLGYKDIRLLLAAADDLRVPLPLASLLRDRFLTLLADDGGKFDWSAIGGLPTKDAHLVEGSKAPLHQ